MGDLPRAAREHVERAAHPLECLDETADFIVAMERREFDVDVPFDDFGGGGGDLCQRRGDVAGCEDAREGERDRCGESAERDDVLRPCRGLICFHLPFLHQAGFLLFHFPDLRSHLIHHLFSLAAVDHFRGLLERAALPRCDDIFHKGEPLVDEQVERIEPALLAGVVRGEFAHVAQAGAQSLEARVVGFEIGLIAGDHVASLARLDIDQ